MVCGTPHYMAPEQVEGRVPDIDASTDQFALAVIAHEMLTGRNPFQADTAGEVFALVLHTDPPPMGVGRDVELVVRRGLAKSNRQRFPAITDFSDALRAAAAGRLRETQWAATVAYAAGEVASHDSKGRSGRRLRRAGADLAAAASIAIAFVVGGEWNRRSSLLGAPVPGPGRRRASPRSWNQLDAAEAESREAQAAESSDAQEEAAEPRDEIEVAPEPAPPIAPETRPRHGPPPGPVVRPAEVSSADSLPVDEDATLPATEPSN